MNDDDNIPGHPVPVFCEIFQPYLMYFWFPGISRDWGLSSHYCPVRSVFSARHEIKYSLQFRCLYKGASIFMIFITLCDEKGILFFINI